MLEIGVAESRAGDASELLGPADAALCRAKESGRDRVVAEGADELTRATE